MSYNWRLGRGRGSNMIEAYPQRLESENKLRWATGRNVKGETSTPGVFQAVEVWTLKERINGKAVTVDTLRTREAAEAWVK